MDDKEVDNNDNNRLVSEPEGDHVETPSEDVGMAVRRTQDGHEEATDPGSPFQDDRRTWTLYNCQLPAWDLGTATAQVSFYRVIILKCIKVTFTLGLFPRCWLSWESQ